MFGEKCFTQPGRSGRVHQESYAALATTRCLEIPGHVLENFCKGPLAKEAHAFAVLDSVITEHPFFAQLQQSTRHALLHEFRQVKIRSNEVVYEDGEAGDSAFVVVTGCLAVSSNDSRVLLRECESTALDLLIEPGEHTMTCRAMETTICWKVSHSSLVEGLGKDVVESWKKQTNPSHK